MIVPRATYRLQFHRGFTLRDALGLVPYLEALGISHVYASPLLRAAPGSTHGYDVCDPSCLNPELGTEADLEALVEALRERGMGLVLDIVPNHMAAVADNPWWWDVLKHGRKSRYADHFDIDWESSEPTLRGRVLLPVLGDALERVLERGELTLDWEGAERVIRYFEHRFPVSPESAAAAGVGPGGDPGDGRLGSDAMSRLLARQHYLLAFWRLGDARLNYRRFFTITGLAGLRVELPQVFEDVHRRILDWHRRGLLDGLRVDHPDGLRDPGGYLRRLADAVPGAWLVVEKILQAGEELPADWPVAGTTGYDFLNHVLGLFVDAGARAALTAFYREFTGEDGDYASLVREKKRWMLRTRFGAEVDRLVRGVGSGYAEGLAGLDASREMIREAVIELGASFEVYRTYLHPGGAVTGQDAAAVERAWAAAREGRPELGPVLDGLRDLLLRGVSGGDAAEFLMRFQQLTGPAMAKGAEDTAFYCHNRFVALNEVGGDPGVLGTGVGAFHGACSRARRRWPDAMLATSTHDTKRSEDVRARLALLSEMPEAWAAAVRRWAALNERHRRGGWPDRNTEYLYYQTLVGAWPLALERALAALQKSAREAGQHTNWIEPDAAYEQALGTFVTGTFEDAVFVAEVERFVGPLVRYGYLNSLSQTVLKLTAPGVPDVHQGTDLWDFSLMDPDNRRPVDYRRRVAMMQQFLLGDEVAMPERLLREPGDGGLKLWVTRQVLRFRQRHPALFREGAHVPLEVTGARARHVCAFARTHEDAAVVVVVPRLVLGLGAGSEGGWPVGDGVWGDTRLVLPSGLGSHVFEDVLAGRAAGRLPGLVGESLAVSAILGRFPLAVLGGADDRARAVCTEAETSTMS